jgi:hypothetical protein
MAQLFLGKVPLLAAEPHEIAESLVQSIQITVLHYCIMPLPAPRCQFRKVSAKRANENAGTESHRHLNADADRALRVAEADTDRTSRMRTRQRDVDPAAARVCASRRVDQALHTISLGHPGCR